ncbi:hypothetical protein EKK58_05175 [Candidatus Dependentiae bacterium]|nr:MAG: hypothetical protein EKK58_05175 [Candidatus Dependentiae bacterium]
MKVDGTFAWHPKVILVGNEAVGAWVRVAVWSAENGTDGWVPIEIALSVAPIELWKRLACARPRGHEHGLIELEETGFQIHDFLESNPTAERATATKKARQRAGRKGGIQSAIRRAGVPFEAGASASAQAESEQTLKHELKLELFVREEKDSKFTDPLSSDEAKPEANAVAHASTRSADNNPSTARNGANVTTAPDLVSRLLVVLQSHGPATSEISTLAFATQLARYAIGQPDGTLGEDELLERVKRAADGVAGAFNTGKQMRSSSGYVLACVRRQEQSPSKPNPAGPSQEDVAGADRFLTFFNKIWSKNRRCVRERAESDAQYALQVWAAVGHNKQIAEAAAPAGAWTPNEEEIIRHWLDEFFGRPNKWVQEANWSLMTFVRGLGSYGMPIEARQKVSSKMAPDDGPIKRLQLPGESPDHFRMPTL